MSGWFVVEKSVPGRYASPGPSGNRDDWGASVLFGLTDATSNRGSVASSTLSIVCAAAKEATRPHARERMAQCRSRAVTRDLHLLVLRVFDFEPEATAAMRPRVPMCTSGDGLDGASQSRRCILQHVRFVLLGDSPVRVVLQASGEPADSVEGPWARSRPQIEAPSRSANCSGRLAIRRWTRTWAGKSSVGPFTKGGPSDLPTRFGEASADGPFAESFSTRGRSGKAA